MAYSYPLALPVLADRLKIASVTWDIQRNDELSGSGDARVWTAELNDPLWTADVELANDKDFNLEQVSAIVRKLYGAQESFFLYHPKRKYPRSDPTGSILGSSTVLVHSIGSNNKSLRLKGLPAGYVLTLTDKSQIVYSSGTRNFFAEVSEDTTAAGDGITPEFEIFPHVPTGLAVNDPVTLKKPACKMFIIPGSFRPGLIDRRDVASGAGFKVMERRR